MSHHSAKNNLILEEEIVKELESGGIIIFAHPGLIFSTTFILLLNRMRKWHTRFFKLHSQKIGNGSRKLLTARELAIYDKFDGYRKDNRKFNYHYADQYRGGYILNYFLAVYAVSLAVISILVLYGGAKYGLPEHFTHWLVFALGVVKFLILLLIWANTRQANGMEFNQRAISARYVMEQFRCMSYLALFDIRRFPVTAEKEYLNKKVKNDHLDKFVLKKMRESFDPDETGDKPIEIHFDERLPDVLTFIRTDWIEPQIKYHRHKLRTQNLLDKRLEKMVNRFNLGILLAVGADVVFGLLPEAVQQLFHGIITPLILATAAIIPALVAALNGLKFQTETRKLAERAGAMTQRLIDLDRDYDLLIKKINNFKDNPDNPGSFTHEAVILVTDSCRVMIDEVTDWMFVYRREVPDP